MVGLPSRNLGLVHHPAELGYLFRYRPRLPVLLSLVRMFERPGSATPIMATDTTDLGAFPLTAIDREIIAMNDEDFPLVKWDELTEIICTY